MDAFAIEYNLSDRCEYKRIDYSTADEMDLRYDAAIGDVTLRSGGAAVRLGWVPLLDFFAAMQYICRQLADGSRYEEFDDTESNIVIAFERQGDMLSIR